MFNLLTGYSRQTDFHTLHVAPAGLRSGLVELIRGQAFEGGRITLKMNSLSDQETIDALYEAAAAGAQVDLIVRGICCLRPGVPGLSETIRARSIVGRYLEHSRLYRFGAGPDATYLIGSADLMRRNLDRRVEVLAPVRDPELQAQLDEVVDVLLADDVLAWELLPDGEWRKVSDAGTVNAQDRLAELARRRARHISALAPPG